MTLLQSLADEILSEILSYLAHEKCLLCNVAVQSKRLSELVRPLLVRQMQFITCPPPKQFRLFLRSVTESSILASMVKDVVLSWGNGVPMVHDLNDALLERLLELRSLTFEVMWDNPPWQHRFLEKNSMHSLAHINLDIKYLTTSDVLKYIFLRRLKSMSISWIEKPTIPKLPSNHTYGDSTISLLKLDSGFHLPEAVLNEILKYPGNLRTLITSLPGYDLPNNYFRLGADLTTSLSPAGVTKALDPTKDSLTELSLVDVDCVWPSHDGSRSDLSDFKALRKLQISSLCYFLPGQSKREGIAHMLPSSLVELEIVYGLDSAICPVPREYETAPLFSNSSDEMTPDCIWLIQLADAKDNGRLPQLERLTLTEGTRNKWKRHDPVFLNTDWTPPNLVTKAYRDVGIELIASARAYNMNPHRGCMPQLPPEVHEFTIIYQREQ